MVSPGTDLAFDGDLAIGRDGEAGIRSAHDIDRLAAQAPGDVEFAHLGQRARREQEQERVLAAQNHDLHGLAARKIFVAVDAAMLALGDLTADGFAIIDLAAIGAEIEPAGVGVLGHHAVGGADEARLVLLVMARHREFQHVDGVALDHIFENRAVVDEARRQRF